MYIHSELHGSMFCGYSNMQWTLTVICGTSVKLSHDSTRKHTLLLLSLCKVQLHTVNVTKYTVLSSTDIVYSDKSQEKDALIN